MVILSLYALRQIEDRLLYPRLGAAVGVRVHFRSPGYKPLAQLVAVLQQAHVVIREMAVEPGENDADTIHLFLKLPRSLDKAKLTALIAEMEEVQSVTLD